MTSTSTKKSIGALTAALLAACIAFQLNASMLSPALVTMARELHTDDATIGLSQTLYFTLAALFSLFLPRLSDIVGRKRVLLGMLAVMLVGSIVAALAVNVPMLFAGRIIQGVTGPVVPICLLVLRNEISDPKRYGAALGLLTAVNGGIAGVDALAGGWIATNFGFRGIFWVIAVVTVLALFLVAVWGVESKPSAGTRMDWIGVVPLVVSVGALLTAFNEAGKLGAANPVLVVGGVVVALVAFAVFWAVESRVREPLVETRFLKRRATWALLATTFLTMTGVFAVVNGLVTSLAQNGDAGFGMEPDLASLVFLTPYALVGWIVGPFAGRLAPTIGYRAVLRFGLIGSIVSTVLMALVGVHSLPVLVTATVLIGITYAGIANIILNGLGIVLSPESNPGFLPGLNAGAFNLGAGVSFAVLPALQIALGVGGSAGTAGYSGGMLLGAAITTVALAISFLIPRPESAETTSVAPQKETVR
ncbi:MFS transporter [Curtobacterium flaccumfaciens pv. flaccumfaciens]|uniref:uridine transporter UriT n=1 Tax=Curtobacterium poinsettiae TaxID=159612 RepID=UPI00217D7D9E|nr:MFS transporter [Curtobacterium flaccumfaciens]MCS6574459.1 MFS transporter [Curtobacterium flaccumfaciens pv. flaccumfaciens]